MSTRKERNERIKREKKIKTIKCLIIVLIILLIVFFFKLNLKNPENQIAEMSSQEENNIEHIDNNSSNEYKIAKVSYQGTNKELTEKLFNIDKCSEEFIDNYFDGINNLQESDEDKLLIVTSLNKIENDYGALNVIPSPNNQYIIQYASNEEKEIALKQFRNDTSILSVDENDVMTLFVSDYNSWGIESMSLNNTISVANNMNLPEVKVAIIDTGCDVELINKYYPGKITEFYDVLEDSTENMSDTYGHGTHIAGTIAEGTPDNVKIIPVKHQTGKYADTVKTIAAINYIVFYEKADIINMSFGGPDFSNALYNAIESANRKNIICVCAAGNDSSSADNYPAAYNNTISIGSVDSELNLSSFSNYGMSIDFVAPGTNIKSTLSSDMVLSENLDDDDDFEVISGTSMATPHVVCAVSILKSYNKSINTENAVDLLKNYAIKDLGAFGKDNYFGYGFIYLNSNSLRQNNSTNGCEEFGIFKNEFKNGVSSFEIESILHTNSNFFSVNNFDPLVINIIDKNGNEKTAKLGDLRDVIIEGYNPYSNEEQTVTISLYGVQKTFNFTNPTDWECGWQYMPIDDNTAKITLRAGANYYGGDYVCKKLYIPERIDNYNIIDIGKIGSFYSYNSTCEEVILPSTLEKITGSNVFYNSSTLEKVTILSSSIDITGEGVFSENKHLLEIDGKISKLARQTFKNDYSLESVTLSDEMTEIPEFAFNNCIGLKNLVFPQNLTLIDDWAFSDVGIVNLDLSNTLVETIDDNAFQGSSVENVILPNTLRIIDWNAFFNSAIKEIVLPNSLETIGGQAFLNVPAERIIVPSSVNEIGSYAFQRLDNSYITIWADKDSYAKTYAVENGVPYEAISCPYIDCSLQSYNFEEYNTVNTDIYAYFDRGIYVGEKYTQVTELNGRKEIIDSDDFEIIYQDNRNSFRAGDTYFTVRGTTQYGEQFEKKFNVVVTANTNIPIKVSKPVKTANIYTYTGEEITFELEGYDENSMTITGNKGTNAGEYIVTVSLKNNYTWEDNSNNDLVFNFEIQKATLSAIDNSSDAIVKYDGESHSVIIDLSFADYNGPKPHIIKYMDGNNEYTLDEKPEFVDIGTYVIKYKLYIDNNYTEYFGEKTLTITSNTINISSSDYEGVYDGNEHTISIDVEADNYTIRYSLDDINYELIELPYFTEVGEYTIYYKISAEGFDDLLGSNKVKIYGLQNIDSSIVVKDNMLIVYSKNDFSNICGKLIVFATSYNFEHLDKDDSSILNTEFTKTGEHIKININGQFNIDYTIGIAGDINGDGKINLKDWTMLLYHRGEVKPLTGLSLLCADIDRNNGANEVDSNIIYSHITEVNPIW